MISEFVENTPTSASSFTENQLAALRHAAELLNSGKLVAIPTETVYGLAANAFDEDAVRAIFATKGRPSNNPLIVHIKALSDLHRVAQNIPELAFRLAEHFWPGPLTLILDKQAHISDTISAGYPTVAVRMPNHSLTLALLNRLDFPLVAPSANRSNHISPTQPEHVLNSLGEKAPFILDGGPCSQGLESTIVGFEKDQVVLYRLGALSENELENFIGQPLLIKSTGTTQIHSPGSSKKHYSPKTPLVLVDRLNEPLPLTEKRIGYLVLQKKFTLDAPHLVIELSEKGDLSEAASRLYAALHEMDAMDLDVIYAEKMPEKGLGNSINDRLFRASIR